MILLNYGQKLNSLTFEQFSAITGKKVAEQVMLPVEYEDHKRYIAEMERAFTKLRLTEESLKEADLVVNPPSNSQAALCVIADLFRITGKFPMIIRMRPSPFGMSIRSDIVEVIDLADTVTP
jgi:hypothetical protein